MCWENLKNGFRKIYAIISRRLAIMREKRLREREIREAARAEAEPFYWAEREKAIRQQEIERAREKAKPTPTYSPSKGINVGSPFSNNTSINKNMGGNKPPISNPMADYLDKSSSKKKGDSQTMANYKFI